MPIIPIFLIFSYSLALIVTSIGFNKELIYYRTSLAGPLATTVDSECLILATKTYDLSMSQATSALHSRASSVCSLFGTLFTGRHASVASYASCLFGVFTNSMHVFFNLFLLAGLNARMRPGSTGRFYISAVVFGSAAFNLLTIGSLLVRTPCRAAVSLYNSSHTLPTVDLVKGADGCCSMVDATQASDLSSSINNVAKGGFFSRKTLVYTIGVISMAGLLWLGKSCFFPEARYGDINGVNVRYPDGDAAWEVFNERMARSRVELYRFEKVGMELSDLQDANLIDPVTGFVPDCFYYRQSFNADFKEAYLRFHHLAPNAIVDWVAVARLRGPGFWPSCAHARDMDPIMSFNHPNNLVLTLLQGHMPLAVGHFFEF